MNVANLKIWICFKPQSLFRLAYGIIKTQKFERLIQRSVTDLVPYGN